MTYLLDTNVCIEVLRRRGSETVRRRLAELHQSDVAICSITRSELLVGAHLSIEPLKELSKVENLLRVFTSFAFDDAAADICGVVGADLTRRGMKIGANDLLIAAIALSRGLTLVSHNTSEFARVTNLRLDDWQAS